MQKININPRKDWQNKVSELGLVWHSDETHNYWDESAYYSLTPQEINLIKQATKDVYEMYVAAGDYIIENNLFYMLDIPSWCAPLIIDAWNDEPPCLNYGRFDFGYDGQQIKLFEFNCDTPTSLLEAAIIQWYWKEDVAPHKAQFNEIHEALVDKFKDIKNRLNGEELHFAFFRENSGEDEITSAYLQDCAMIAGIRATNLKIDYIGWHKDNYFVDDKDAIIRNLFKLYPWEWMVREEYGPKLCELSKPTNFMEPIWKMLWSNKAILPILYRLFPNSPYLLEADFEPLKSGNYVKKPILAREGANIEIFHNHNLVAQSDGNYDSNAIYQEYFQLLTFENKYPIIGSWIIDTYPAGIGIREGSMITDNLASFIPHIIENT